MNDRIEKFLKLPTPVFRVWRALTGHLEFGRLFGVKLDAPFAVGEPRKTRVAGPCR